MLQALLDVFVLVSLLPPTSTQTERTESFMMEEVSYSLGKWFHSSLLLLGLPL